VARKVFDGGREFAYRFCALDGLLSLRRLSALCAFHIDRVGLLEVVLGDEQANVERLDHRLAVPVQVQAQGGWVFGLAPADQVKQRPRAFEALTMLGIPLRVTLTAARAGYLRDALRGIAEDGVQPVAKLTEHLDWHRDQLLRRRFRLVLVVEMKVARAASVASQ